MAYATWDACFVHLVELLVRSGAQLGTTNGFEETPLYIAGMGFNSDMVQCLLDREALGDSVLDLQELKYLSESTGDRFEASRTLGPLEKHLPLVAIEKTTLEEENVGDLHTSRQADLDQPNSESPRFRSSDGPSSLTVPDFQSGGSWGSWDNVVPTAITSVSA